MKRDKLNVILFIVFIVGLSVMLYPLVSNYWNSRTQSKAVASYDEAVRNMTAEDYNKMLADAEQYNRELRQLNYPYMEYDKVEGYEDVLNVSDTGIMGYITIERIGVELPIYHGTSEGVLQVAVGHLEGSGLPVGGVGTHSVLSAHRGLPSAKLFTNLDVLQKGDTFQVTVLNRVMTYEVDQIRIVMPDEITELTADPQKDYCTLMTCTPYGINSHRLLVRGVRVANDENGNYIPADASLVNTSVTAIVIGIAILSVMLLGSLLLRCLDKKRKR